MWAVKNMILFYLSTLYNNIKVAMQYIFSKILSILRRFATVYNLLMLVVNIWMIYQFSLNLCTLIYIDSIYYVIDFIRNIFNEKISDKQVLINNDELYKTDSLNRYFYYLLLSVTHTYLKYFVFNTDILFLKYIFGLLIVPFIFNNYIYPKLSHIFAKLTIKKNRLIKKICSEQIACAIIQLNKLYMVNMDLIDKGQLVDKLTSVTDIQTHIYTFIKNTLATVLMMKLRKSSTIYYKLTKYAYMYNSGDYLQNISLDEAKKIYMDTIKFKRYEEMAKPMFIQSVIYLYYSQNTSKYFETLVLYLRYKFVICVSLLTIASFITGSQYKILAILAGSLFINFTRRLPLRRDVYATKLFKFLRCDGLSKYLDDRDVFALIATIASGFITDKTVFMSAINQFAGILFVNDVMHNVVKLLYKYVQKKIPVILLHTHYDNTTIVKYICVILCHVFFSRYNLPYIYTIHILPCFILDIDVHRYIYPMMMSGLANNDNIFKLVLFGYILGIIDNMLTCRKLIITKTPNIKMFGRSPEIYDEYCGGKTQIFMLNDIKPNTADTKLPKIANPFVDQDDKTPIENNEWVALSKHDVIDSSGTSVTMMDNIIDNYMQTISADRSRSNSSVGSSTSAGSTETAPVYIVRTEHGHPRSKPMTNKTYRLIDNGYDDNPFYDGD